VTPEGLYYFAYGTLQRGFPNWPDLAELLGEPLGRFRTVAPYAVVVPLEPGCANPGCAMLHRMAALVPGVEGCRVEGDVFAIDRCALPAIDRLEGYDERREPPGLYVRAEIAVEPAGGREPEHVALTYVVSEPELWRALAASGAAEMVERYEPHHAHVEPKRCCVTSPGHAGAHDVVDPLARVR
jgi:gamma-glutamylcyclotransferase (GGCT)/AIG2-like uncharacterized protein YtfP